MSRWLPTRSSEAAQEHRVVFHMARRRTTDRIGEERNAISFYF